MKDVWAITCRIMSRLLARLRRRTALTAAFQSNQNDRVTLERRREDIFLASRSHRGCCLFLFPTHTPPFLYLFDLIPTPVTWPPGFCRDACFAEELNARDVGGPLSRKSRHEIDCFTSLALLWQVPRSLFLCSSCVDKMLFFAFWVTGRVLDSTFENHVSAVFFAELVAHSTVGWNEPFFLPFVLIAAWCFVSALRFKYSGKVWRKEERRPPAGRGGGCSQAETTCGSTFCGGKSKCALRLADPYTSFTFWLQASIILCGTLHSRVACWFVSWNFKNTQLKCLTGGPHYQFHYGSVNNPARSGHHVHIFFLLPDQPDWPLVQGQIIWQTSAASNLLNCQSLTPGQQRQHECGVKNSAELNHFFEGSVRCMDRTSIKTW